MAPSGRANPQRAQAQREGRSAEATGGHATTARRGMMEGEEHQLLKQENEALKRSIQLLRGKLNSATSGSESSSDARQELLQKELNEGQKASIGAYVSGLYGRLKFLNNETLAAFPNVLQKALGQLVMVKTNETTENYKTATIKEMRYLLSQKRQYSKKQIMKKYLGKCGTNE